MQKIKNIKTWKIKEEFLNDEFNPLILKSLNGNLIAYANLNQTIGAICENCSEKHIESLFQVYTTLGIFLAKNNMIDINFKLKKDEAPKPQRYLG